MKCFSYEGECGVHKCMLIKVFKRRAVLGYRSKQIRVISNEIFKTITRDIMDTKDIMDIMTVDII